MLLLVALDSLCDIGIEKAAVMRIRLLRIRSRAVGLIPLAMLGLCSRAENETQDFRVVIFFLKCDGLFWKRNS